MHDLNFLVFEFREIKTSCETVSSYIQNSSTKNLISYFDSEKVGEIARYIHKNVLYAKKHWSRCLNVALFDVCTVPGTLVTHSGVKI